MECNICFETLDKITTYVTPCIHKFCIYCIKKWSDSQYKYTSEILCPVCRHNIDYHNIKSAYNHMMDMKIIQEHMVEYKSKKISTYEEFLLLDGVDVAGDKYITLDMVESNKWIKYISKLLFVRQNFYGGSDRLLYRLLYGDGIYVVNNDAEKPYAKEIIFKMFKKKIYIRNKMVIVEITPNDNILLDSIQKIIRERVKLFTEIEGLQIINIDSDEIIGHSIVVKTTKKTGFAIKLNEYNCYYGDSEIDLMKYENLSTVGNIGFHIIGLFSKEICGYKYYANAIEISIDRMPSLDKGKIEFRSTYL